MISNFLLMFFFVCLAICFFKNNGRKKGKKNLLPGPKAAYSYIWHIIKVFANPGLRNYEHLEKLSEEYGPIFGLYLGTNYIVAINDYQAAKEVMSSDLWSSRVPLKDYIKERSFGKNIGIVWANGDSWKHARRYTLRNMREFGFGKLKSMETFIECEMKYFIPYFAEKVSQQDGIICMDHHMISLPILNLTISMIGGFRFEYDDKMFKEFLKAGWEMTRAVKPGINLLHMLPVSRYIPYLTEQQIVLKVHKQLSKLFKDIIEERKLKGTYKTSPQDFFEIYLRDLENPTESGSLTEEEFLTVLIDLFFASADTTGAAVEFALLYMIHNPHVAAKVQQEIEEQIGTKMPSCEDRRKMPYTEAVMLETFRWASINPVAGRSPTEDTFLRGFHIPKDSVGVIILHGLHNSEEVWGDPKVFRPERFLDKDMKIINSNKVLAFGQGKRNCIGELQGRNTFFVFFTTLMQLYSFEKSPCHGLPNLNPKSGITNSPYPFYTLVKPRNILK